MQLTTRDLRSSVEDRASTSIGRVAIAPVRVHILVELTSLPMIEIYALKGAPPMTGFEEVVKSFQFTP